MLISTEREKAISTQTLSKYSTSSLKTSGDGF